MAKEDYRKVEGYEFVYFIGNGDNKETRRLLVEGNHGEAIAAYEDFFRQNHRRSNPLGKLEEMTQVEILLKSKQI